MKNITQTALELGVSRKRIYDEIKRLNIQTQKDGKNTCISDDDYKRLMVRVTEHVMEQTRYTTERTRNIIEHDRNMIGTNISDREYTDLKERIRFLEEQLNIKDQQINIKDQQIQAKDNQINGLIQTNLNLYKALNPPDQEIAVTKTNKPRNLWIKKLFKIK